MLVQILARRFWPQTLARKNVARKCWPANSDPQILARKYWPANFGPQILTPKFWPANIDPQIFPRKYWPANFGPQKCGPQILARKNVARKSWPAKMWPANVGPQILTRKFWPAARILVTLALYIFYGFYPYTKFHHHSSFPLSINFCFLFYAFIISSHIGNWTLTKMKKIKRKLLPKLLIFWTLTFNISATKWLIEINFSVLDSVDQGLQDIPLLRESKSLT